MLDSREAEPGAGAALDGYTGYTVRDSTPAATNSHAGLRHIRGIDGLRAVAVLAVVVFHGEVGVLPGGFIGVDIFFVVSGFLITSLLLSEHATSGSVSLGSFWVRRFRRLLPAVALLLVGVAVYAAVLADPTTLRSLRWDSIWALGYAANWRFVLSGQDYASTVGAPSPVNHLWSLSVEEQWYLLWPLVVAGCLAVSARRPRLLAGVVVGGIVASASWMAYLSLTGASTSRAYYGTDSRAFALLVGAGVALLMRRVVVDGYRQRRAGRRLLQWAGPAAAALLAWMIATASLTDTWMYRGGFLLVALASGVVVMAVVSVRQVSRVLDARTLKWVGQRSYGIYLWHWLVLLAVTKVFVGLTPWPRLGLVLVVSFVLAALSYRFVEQPIRTQKVSVPLGRWAVPISAAVLASVLVVGTVGAKDAPDYLAAPDLTKLKISEPPAVPPSTAGPADPAAPSTTAAPSVPGPGAAPSPAPSSGPAAAVPPTIQPPTTQPPAPVRPRRVAMVGDSVGASLADALTRELFTRGIGFGSGAAPGCGVVEGDPADASGNELSWTRLCGRAIPALQLQVVDRTRPELVVVLSTWETSDRIVDGTLYKFGTPQADEELLSLYGRMVDRLSLRGAQVALLTVPPPVASPRGPVDGAEAEKYEHLNTVMDLLAVRRPGQVRVIRFDDIVCPSSPCPTVVEGRTLRPKDGRHFDDPDAATWVAGRLADRVAALDLRR